jgi:hypothetical protein
LRYVSCPVANLGLAQARRLPPKSVPSQILVFWVARVGAFPSPACTQTTGTPATPLSQVGACATRCHCPLCQAPVARDRRRGPTATSPRVLVLHNEQPSAARPRSDETRRIALYAETGYEAGGYIITKPLTTLSHYGRPGAGPGPGCG